MSVSLLRTVDDGRIDVCDWFSGLGGTSRGFLDDDRFRVLAAANHNPNAVMSYGTNHPKVDVRLTDLQFVDPVDFPAARVLISTPECFVAGTLILAATGWTPIEDIDVGDLVLTHTGKWKPVTRTQSREVDELTHVGGHGHSFGLTTTPNHQFWARRSHLANSGTPRRRRSDPDWMRADELVESEAFWATPIQFEALPVDRSPSLAGWWTIGRWLGDGSYERGGLTISCGRHEADELEQRLAEDDNGPWRRRELRTATAFTHWNADLARWFEANFGRGSAHKTLPPWVYAIDEANRRALLDGYVSADGNIGRRVQVDTVSRKLALSIRLLAESLGHRASLLCYEQRDNPIEGRQVNFQLHLWKVTWESNPRRLEAFADDRHAWNRVRFDWTFNHRTTVYNIEVADDHSYVAEGIVVKNCTNHSGAQARRLYERGPAALNDDDPDFDFDEYVRQERSRATMACSLRYAERHLPEFCVHENVVEVAWWGNAIEGKKRGDGTTYKWWKQQWRRIGYEVHELFMNASAFGAPQSRDRFIMLCRRRDVPVPNLDFRPPCFCHLCDGIVQGVQTWKPRTKAWPLEKWGRMGPQYFYACPTHPTVKAELIVNGADTIVDWSDLGETLGQREDRGDPLADSTIERIEHGLRKLGGVEGLVHLTRQKQYGTDSSVFAPMNTITTRQDWALSVPPAMVVELRSGGSIKSGQRPVTLPMGTITSGGNNHYLASFVSMHAQNNGSGTSTNYHPMTDALGTVTRVDSNSLASIRTDAEFDMRDVHMRMFSPDELKQAQTLPKDYKIVAGSKREQVQLIGDAVPPVLAHAVAARLADALEGRKAIAA